MKKLSLIPRSNLNLKPSHLGVTFRSNMAHPSMSSYLYRLKTFPRALFPLDVQQIAEAGFFYGGYSDYTICFFCSGSVHRWQSTDDPWWEHSRYFPHCPFVRLAKGEDFVCNSIVKMKQKAESLPDLRVLQQRRENKCWICIQDETSIAFLPCGHTFTCGKCAAHFKKCPLCQQEILALVRVYIS